jgi:hypothetical protein
VTPAAQRPDLEQEPARERARRVPDFQGGVDTRDLIQIGSSPDCCWTAPLAGASRTRGQARRQLEVSLPPPLMLRRGVFGGIDAVGVGWWSAVRQVVAGVASRPHGPPDDGPGTTRPDWPGRSGRRWPGGGRGRGRRWGGRGGCRAGGLAGDQDPGHRPVTGQPATPSGANGPTQPTSPPTAARPWRLSSSPAPSAGVGPTSLGQPARPQGPGGPARPGHQPGVGRRCGHRRRWPGGPGVPGRPASSGRPRPPTAHPGPPCPPGSGPATGPAPLMVAFGLGLGAVRVGDQPQVSDQLAQPRRVQAPGHLHQDRFGLGGDRGGQLVGADGQHPGVGRRQLAVGQGGGRLGRGRGTRPGRSGHWWGRPRRPCGAGPAASWRWSRTEHPGRRRRPRGRPPQPARPATGLPAGPAAAAAQGPARPAPGRAGRPGPGRPSPPPPLPTARAPPQARPRPGDAPVVQPNVCSYPWRQPINPHQNTSTTMKFGDNFPTHQPSAVGGEESPRTAPSSTRPARPRCGAGGRPGSGAGCPRTAPRCARSPGPRGRPHAG